MRPASPAPAACAGITILMAAANTIATFAGSSQALFAGVAIGGPPNTAVTLRAALLAAPQPGLAGQLLAAPFADFVVTLACGALEQTDAYAQTCACVTGASRLPSTGAAGGAMAAGACACDRGWAPVADGSGCQPSDSPLPVGAVASLSASFSAAAFCVCTAAAGAAALRRLAHNSAAKDVEKLMISASELTAGLPGRVHALSAGAAQHAPGGLSTTAGSSTSGIVSALSSLPVIGSHLSRAFSARSAAAGAPPSGSGRIWQQASRLSLDGFRARAPSVPPPPKQPAPLADSSASASLLADSPGTSSAIHFVSALAAGLPVRRGAAAAADLSKGGAAVYRGALRQSCGIRSGRIRCADPRSGALRNLFWADLAYWGALGSDLSGIGSVWLR